MKAQNPLEFIFECRAWPSKNEWKKHPMAYYRQQQEWIMGATKKRKYWAGSAGEIHAQWLNAGKPRFQGKAFVHITLFFKARKGREEDNYSPKWLLDILREPHGKNELSSVRLGIIKSDAKEFCDHKVTIIEGNSDRDFALVRIVEVAATE